MRRISICPEARGLKSSWVRPALIAGTLVLVQGAWVAASSSNHEARLDSNSPLNAGIGASGGRSGATSSGWTAQLQQDLAEREYEITWQSSTPIHGVDASWQAPNRAQGFRTYFTPDGIRLVPREARGSSWSWGLSLVAYGEGEEVRHVATASLSASGRRIGYHRAGIEESYENTPDGLEQRFVLSAKPARMHTGKQRVGGLGWTTSLRAHPVGAHEEPGADGGRLQGDTAGWVHLDLALSGDLSPKVAEDGQSIAFVAPAGGPILHYGSLKATDGSGRILAAWMEGFSGENLRGIRLVVDARYAVYPITIDPLSTSPAWSVIGSERFANLGKAVATAGDVNGDGFSDVVVGAPLFDSGQTDEGEAFLYLGSPSGLSTTAAWTGQSNIAGLHYGSTVASAGDVNGDGYADVIIGSNSSDTGLSLNDIAYLYLGSATGLATTPAWTRQTSQFDSGANVAGAGDVNGDGYADVLVGEPEYSSAPLVDEGHVFLYQGTASGLSMLPAWEVDGDQNFAILGFSVASAGDVNGD